MTEIYTDYQFADGTDYSGMASANDAFPQGPGIGIESGQGTESASNSGGAQAGGENANEGLTSDGSSQFSDSQDNRVFQGMDSMAGVAGLDGIHVEQPEQAEMYSSQSSLPFDFPIDNTSEPLLDLP